MLISSAKEFGGIIKKARKDQGMTQVELAGACGVSPRFIIELEKGKLTSEIGKALLVAKLLGIKLEAYLPPSEKNLESE